MKKVTTGQASAAEKKRSASLRAQLQEHYMQADLEEAEHCDPYLAIRVCRHLDLPVPENGPRMNKA